MVTGASRGIGKAIALEFAKNGCDLYLTCKTNFSMLENLKEQVEKEYSIHCSIFTCDMGNFSEVTALFKQIPSLDILVNNAGISHVGLLTDMSVEEWQAVMAVNLDSVFYTCKFAVSKMLEKHQGKVINISSVWGNIGASMEVAYSASKGAVNSFTKALAKELAPSNIQVNAIACGFIDTQMNAGFSKEELESIVEEIPADRTGQPEEVASFCRMLAEAPEYLTGQIMTLDGGWT